MLSVALVAAPAARADRVESAMGVPCAPGPNDTQICESTLATRVPSWDGVPLDVQVVLPPPDRKGPFPLIVSMHGWPLSKEVAFDRGGPQQALAWAGRGYAVLAYSARGFGQSCGVIASRIGAGCDRGWLHLADTRYEVRDTQYLTGLLADELLIVPDRVGVTGASYGGGQTLLLATLRDRTMLQDGTLVPWRSPKGKPIRIAAAAPRIAWSDLAYALVPNGRTLDYRAQNPYEQPFGVLKQSWIDTLYETGAAAGYYAPPGADPDSDITVWREATSQGEPYTTPQIQGILGQFTRFRSPYYLQDPLPASQRETPPPMILYNAWTDDIFGADEALRYANRIKAEYPGARIGMVFADEFGHPRASLTASAPEATAARDVLFARYLLGDEKAHPLEGVTTLTQGCNGREPEGPFTTQSWDGQHPGQVRYDHPAPKTFTSAGGSSENSNATDPVSPSQGSCRTVSADDDPGAATYRLPAAEGAGYTLMGSPTVTAAIGTTGAFPQIDSRLWDVAPDGDQTLVTHGIYRPDASGVQTFQLHPNGWRFAAGHVPKLELLGRDAPYARPSNGEFTVTASKLRFTLPVRECSGPGVLCVPTPPAGPCARVRKGPVGARRVGPARLGRGRAANRRAFPTYVRVSAGMDRFCVAGGGAIRVGYRLPGKRVRVQSRALVAVASSRRIRAAGLRAGSALRKGRVRSAWRLSLGRDTWYVRRTRRATLVFRVRGGRVREVGVAARGLTRSRRASRALLKRFR
ncbi:MAG TPA: CocE/NonD family hydrolase [Thermoleophilaceae bacterium]